jgi:7-cyano-7-deazaguanine reductase
MVVNNYASKRFDIDDTSAVDSGVLESIKFEYPESTTNVTYETDEFTSVCPWTGLPDFARLRITYRPLYRLVELKSLKYYLTSYRNVGILQEHAVNRMLQDLVALLQPTSINIEAWYNERGGLKTYVQSTHPRFISKPTNE